MGGDGALGQGPHHTFGAELFEQATERRRRRGNGQRQTKGSQNVFHKRSPNSAKAPRRRRA